MRENVNKFINEIKNNFFGDIIFLSLGILTGYIIKILIK